MAVERNREIEFPNSREQVIAALREVFTSSTAFTNVREGQGGSSFETQYCQHWWTEPTLLRVAIADGSPGKVVVSAQTVSGPHVVADVFGFYNRMLRTFLAALETKLDPARPSAGGQPISGPGRVPFVVRAIAGLLGLLIFAAGLCGGLTGRSVSRRGITDGDPFIAWVWAVFMMLAGVVVVLLSLAGHRRRR